MTATRAAMNTIAADLVAAADRWDRHTGREPQQPDWLVVADATPPIPNPNQPKENQ